MITGNELCEKLKGGIAFLQQNRLENSLNGSRAPFITDSANSRSQVFGRARASLSKPE